jgi:hypothetical protein
MASEPVAPPATVSRTFRVGAFILVGGRAEDPHEILTIDTDTGEAWVAGLNSQIPRRVRLDTVTHVWDATGGQPDDHFEPTRPQELTFWRPIEPRTEAKGR